MTITDSESADLPTPTGPMRTYVFRPVAGGRYPGLVLYSEIFQVTGPIRRMAAMLASHGFLVCCIINKLTVGCDENYPHAS
jgi:carboxymethylenebutenolidase